MSADIINLRRARKDTARKRREQTADQNRRLHGRRKAEKEKQAAERERLEREIAGHRMAREED